MKKVAIDRELHTDVGNARRLVGRYGNRIRFVHGWGRWIIWDGVRWSRDTRDEITRLAKEVVRDHFRSACEIKDEDRRKRGVKHGLRSEQRQRITAMVDLAKSEPSVAIAPDALDRDPFALNCLNGTINLKTGRLRRHNLRDLITKLAPVVYDPHAHSDEWERFLDHATGGDNELRQYLQRTFGYSSNGLTREEIVLLLVGGTGTGKTTILEAQKAALGDYAKTSDFDTFLKRGDRGARNDLARLQGARLVTASEVPPGRQFDEATVKQLTGGDRIAARFLYGEFFEFEPQFTIWLAVNHRPTVRDDDPAIWRRLKVIPFDQAVPKDQLDTGLKERLRNPEISGPAVLAWIVKGAVAWHRKGLSEPAAVTSATRAYRDEMETFSQFIEDCCVLAPEQWVASNTFQRKYESWSTAGGFRYPYGPKRVREMLRSRGCVPEKQGQVRGWKGIGLVAS